VVDVSAMPNQVYLRIDGDDAPEELMQELQEATIDSTIHLPAVATLVVNDPGLRWIDDARLLPGRALEVLVKIERQEQVIFDGEIVELEPEFGKATHRLIVRAFDRLHRLSRGRHVRSFQQVTDSDLVEKLASEAGLQVQVESTPVVHEYVLQHNQTNLEFLRERLAPLGYQLFMKGKTLHCEPVGRTDSQLNLQWGVELSDFRPRMTTMGQVENVIVRGWDPDLKQEIIGDARNEEGRPAIGESRAGGELVSEAFNLNGHGLVTHQPVRQQAMADALARTTAARIAGRFIEAEGNCAGDPDLMSGVTISVSGIGDRFSGEYLVTGATHIWNPQGYRTSFAVSGQEPATLHHALQDAVNPDWFNMRFGLAVGVVTDNQDPQRLGRVKIWLPWLTGSDASYWARVIAPGAGNDRGIWFMPEINDQVLVGFEYGDIHYPYVLGGLWNQDNPPPSGEVDKRVLRSRLGHTITLDDSGSGSITIEDPSGNRVKIDTGSRAMTIDIGGNIDITAQGNLKLTAQGQLELRGMGITIDGTPGGVTIRGTTIDLN
jgi:phage protein D/phage baseplate assembly protein gpV